LSGDGKTTPGIQVPGSVAAATSVSSPNINNVIFAGLVSAATASVNSAALSTAMSAACAVGGGLVQLPAGTFQVNTNVTPCSNLTLKGAGIDSTILQAGSTGINIVNISSTNNFILEDLTLDGNGLGSGLYISKVRNVQILRVRFTSSVAGKPWDGLYYGNNINGLKVKDCIFEGPGDNLGLGLDFEYDISQLSGEKWVELS
jgi:hypothetical protein